MCQTEYSATLSQRLWRFKENSIVAVWLSGLWRRHWHGWHCQSSGFEPGTLRSLVFLHSVVLWPAYLSEFTLTLRQCWSNRTLFNVKDSKLSSLSCTVVLLELHLSNNGAHMICFCSFYLVNPIPHGRGAQILPASRLPFL